MKRPLAILLLALVSSGAFSQTIINFDPGIDTFVTEDHLIQIFSGEDMVSYELWDLSRDKRKLSQVINAPAGSKAINHVIINPYRLKEGDYMIKLIREVDVKKVWFTLPSFKDRKRQKGKKL